MRKLILAVTLLLSGFAGGAANAMPVGDVASTPSSNVVAIDYSCGRGYHLSPRGFCRPNEWAPPPRPRYYSDRWDRRGPPHRYWREHRYYRQW
jgi:hypothetical protein